MLFVKPANRTFNYLYIVNCKGIYIKHKQQKNKIRREKLQYNLHTAQAHN